MLFINTFSNYDMKMPICICKVDPTGHYAHGFSHSELLDACGILPQYVTNSRFSHLPLQEALAAQYVCGGNRLYEMTGGTVHHDGIFTYPGDPAQYPLLKINRGKEIFYQYNYAIVAVIDADGTVFVTRMD